MAYVGHLGELASQQHVRVGTQLSIGSFSDYTTKICWQGYAIGFVAVPVGRRLDDRIWRPHLILVVLNLGSAENIPQRAVMIQHGTALVRSVLRRRGIEPPSPLFHQLNTDWVPGPDKSIELTTPGTALVNDLGHWYQDTERQCKKCGVQVLKHCDKQIKLSGL